MFGLFCLRLAFGLLLFLLPLWAFPINPRFFRAHFLTALGLSVAALFLLEDVLHTWLFFTLFGAVGVCLLGSMAWWLEDAPGGRVFIVLGVILTGYSLLFVSQYHADQTGAFLMILAENFTAAALLGSATTAMLLGHSYLIAPTLSIQPLLRLLAALGGCLLLRSGLALWQLWLWTEAGLTHNLETEPVLWLLVRWGVGLLAPLVLGWMAWETARIRSTQSATGILYVVVICCFLGELTGQLLFDYMIIRF